MRILIVRHGDPNYEINSLTEVGWKEAELAAERISKLDVKEFYLSPLGRAQDTASCTLKKMNRTGITYEWLREFSPRIHRPDKDITKICWDWLPQDWTIEQKYYDLNTWADTPIMQEGNVRAEYEWVCKEVDNVLEKHGYAELIDYVKAEELPGEAKEEAPSIKEMKRLELADNESSSDSGNHRMYPNGQLVFNLIKDWQERIAKF